MIHLSHPPRIWLVSVFCCVLLTSFPATAFNLPGDFNNTVLGGVIYVSGVNLSFEASMKLSGNYARAGGVVYAARSDVVFKRAMTMKNNKAMLSVGGAVVAYHSNVSFKEAAYFNNNWSKTHGGVMAVYCDESADPLHGSGMSCPYSMVFAGTAVFNNNYAGIEGGAIDIWNNSTIIFEDYAEFKNNTAGYHGGALDIEFGKVEFRSDTNWDGNQAERGNGGAAGLWNWARLVFKGNNVFRNNRAGINGGAIIVSLESGTSLNLGSGSTTFSGNYALNGSNIQW